MMYNNFLSVEVAVEEGEEEDGGGEEENGTGTQGSHKGSLSHGDVDNLVDNSVE